MKLTDRYRPKADRTTLNQLNDLAWQEINDRLMERVQNEIGEILTCHLEKLYPAADMEFLSRYGCSSPRDEAHIQVRLPEGERWEHHVSIKLPRTIQVATSYHGLWAGGPRFSRQPNRGVSAEARAELESGKADWSSFPSWEAFCADQDEREARRVPEEAESFLYELVETRLAYNRDYRRLTEWTETRKRETGLWPTWGDIAAEFPIVGKKIELAAFTSEAHSTGRAVDHIDGDSAYNDPANLQVVTLK